MTRSSLPIAVALAASAGLLLTACGGGGSDSSDKIQPSATVTTAAPTATSASPTQAAGPNAPKFDLPSDAKAEFSGFDTSDVEKKDVLRDVKNAILTIQEAEAVGKGNTPNIKRYFAPVQAATLSDMAIAYRKSGYTITGTVKDYRPTVKFDASDRAQVTYCEDQSHAYDKLISTGEVQKSTPSVKDYSLWRMGLAKNAAGDWQVTDYSQQKGVSKCAGS
ncbi:hypothetical protein [Streptomyces sp. CBMA29]|uniref:hypothetical protein n=1 Tax=Streptomyces sp. CBMA29 TaxID=1896314 RepID=UPI001662142E|nr:hypothetical protein [Streptomyces sp. CBMA29]MBD0740047.1 hypothetical protein [Streptomyces sp. CBMA29]